MARFADSTPTPAARPNFTRGDAPSAPTTPGVTKNRYGARCVNCGVWVPEGEGRLTKDRTNKWVVSHIPPCPEVEAAPEVPDGNRARVGGHWQDAPKATPVGFSVPDGRYTVIFENGHKTIRVAHQDEFDTFMPGKVILGYLAGPDNGRDYTSFGHVRDDGSVSIWKKHQGNETLREAVKVLLGDPKAASKAYARESKHCGVCNRELTNPESIEAGIGPVCAERNGWL